jgi:hypothetical protein
MSEGRFAAQPLSLTEDRAMAALMRLDHENQRAGANVQMESYRITAELPSLRKRIEESDRLVSQLGGAKRLRPRRRLGILRHTLGPLCGLPYFDPPMYATKFAPEPRSKPLWDELELIVIPGRAENGVWRPAKDELTFDEARAIAMMKAGTFYRHTSKKGRVPGIIHRRLDEESTSHTSGLRFDTVEFMTWRKVLRRLQ